MSNILQVTTPVNDNSRNAINTQTKNLSESQQLQNPVDPTRVVRADGQTGNKAGDAMSEAANAIVDYESNYGAFIKRMGEGQELPRLLEQLFQAENAAVLFTDQEATAPLLEQLFSSMQMNSPEELLAFLQTQMEQQVKFSGTFFDGLRRLLSENRSDSAKEAILSFLRSYNSMSSGEHTLKQMKSLTEDIGRLMFRQFQGEYQDILDDMDWDALEGETRANSAVLNQRLIPFLASYISKTHDYGPVRNAVMLFIFHAVKYEEGDKGRLFQLFDKMLRIRGFDQVFDKEEAYGELQRLLSGGQKTEDEFADAFSKLVEKGANGAAGLENIQQFYNIMNGMLVNESVYLPLIHLLLPFRFGEEQVMSEMWVDPDSESEDAQGRRIKMFLKFDIRSLGHFDMVLVMENRQVGMQLYVPPALKERSEHISRDVTGIFKKSGLSVGQLLVREKKGELKVTDVFPEIREKERTINVRI
ncbi:MAG: hypothetical protein HFI63_08270 [Lachnospiraceae bacterium]|nr:hypothetical protein [Lachnospiraceae bacterium]